LQGTDLSLELARCLARALDDHAHRIAARQLGDRLQKHALAVATDHAHGRHDHPGPGAHAPALGQGFDSLAADRLGVELADVDAAPDHAQPLLRHAVILPDVLGDVFGHGDDPIASGHDRAVMAPENTAAAAVDAVDRGDERHLATPCGIIRAPRRRPRAGVHQADLAVADQALQATNVGVDLQRIPGVHGQLKAARAAGAEFGLAAAAARGDQGAPAAFDEIARQIGRAALHAALIDPG
jgi:hypothetical protein